MQRGWHLVRDHAASRAGLSLLLIHDGRAARERSVELRLFRLGTRDGRHPDAIGITAREQRRARRRANRLRHVEAGEPRPLAREPVNVRRLDIFVLETVAVGALLVGGDEQYVGT